MKRRGVFKLGATLTAAGTAAVAVPGAASAQTTTQHGPLTPAQAAKAVKRVFDRETARAGGDWQARVTVLDGAGAVTAVDQNATAIRTAASMNKLGIALGVLDKIDRGELALDHRITLDADIILTGSGFYFHQTAYGDELTVANILVALLMPSDNTAVRLCGLVCPPAEINATLEAKGFTDTRVIPSDTNPNRMWLGNTTTAETNELLARLAAGELLSQRSTRFMLGVLRGLSGYHDGFRRNMSSAERSRVAMKYGADDANRNEAGVVYNASGRPALVYSFMAQIQGHDSNYGATHPVVEAHARMGRSMFDIVARIQSESASGASARSLTDVVEIDADEPFHPGNGG
jgi:beta-lactamase class A